MRGNLRSVGAASLLLLGTLAACATTPAAPATAPSAWVVTELVFGFSREGKPPVSDGEWMAFLRSEITPRFPGYTVLEAAGYWTGADGGQEERSRVLRIAHPRAPDIDSKLEAVRSAFKTRFGQESVLRIDTAAAVDF